MIKHFAALSALITFVALTACNRDSSQTNKSAPTDDVTAKRAEDQSASTGTGAGHGGQIIELGTATIGGYTVRASRDEGQITPGGDAPIDVWLTDGTAKVVAVRFWIGTEDAAGSIKSKADIENPAEPNHWHTHAEVPDPLPTGAKLWVEIEVEGQAKSAGSFELRI